MGFQAGIQILLIMVSGIIIMTVIKPEFDTMLINQDELAEYNDAVSKADVYNSDLEAKIASAKAFPRSDLIALDRFIPSEIDKIAVARDIRTIAESNGMIVGDISAADSEAVNVADSVEARQALADSESVAMEVRSSVISQLFELQAIGSYQNLKDLLRDFERNAYPLRAKKIEFAADDDSMFYSFSIHLETYALPAS